MPPRKPNKRKIAQLRAGMKKAGRRSSVPPLKLRVAKALDKINELFQGQLDPEVLSANDRKVLERVQNRLTGAVTSGLTPADLTNVKRIAKKLHIDI